MPFGVAPNVSARAGAITMANSSGAITGTSSSRGVRMLSISRRRASVATAEAGPGSGAVRRCGGAATMVVTAVMRISFEKWATKTHASDSPVVWR